MCAIFPIARLSPHSLYLWHGKKCSYNSYRWSSSWSPSRCPCGCIRFNQNQWRGICVLLTSSNMMCLLFCFFIVLGLDDRLMKLGVIDDTTRMTSSPICGSRFLKEFHPNGYSCWIWQSNLLNHHKVINGRHMPVEHVRACYLVFYGCCDIPTSANSIWKSYLQKLSTDYFTKPGSCFNSFILTMRYVGCPLGINGCNSFSGVQVYGKLGLNHSLRICLTCFLPAEITACFVPRCIGRSSNPWVHVIVVLMHDFR